MRTLLVILAAVAVCLAIDGATTPYNFSPATKAYSSQVNANFDSLRIPLNKMKDTLNLKMVRYAKVYRNHDSTFQWMNIDTIKGPVRIDTANIDTAYVGRGVAITAGLSVGAALSGLTGSFSSWIYTADSVLADAGVVTLGPVKGATGVFTSAVTVDSLKSTKGISATTGTFSGTVTVDSLKSTKGISYAGAGINTTNGIFSGKVTATDSMRTNGSMRAATGVFTSTLAVDSLYSTKSIAGPTLNTGQGNNELYSMNQNVLTTSAVVFDTVTSTKGIAATTGKFSSTVSGDSVYSTKAIQCPTINTGQGSNEVYGMDQNVKTTSAVEFNKSSSDTVQIGADPLCGMLRFGNYYESTISNDTLHINGSSFSMAVDTGVVNHITGCATSQILYLTTGNAAGNVTLTDGADLFLNGNFVMSTQYVDWIVLINIGIFTSVNKWAELCRSDN